MSGAVGTDKAGLEGREGVEFFLCQRMGWDRNGDVGGEGKGSRRTKELWREICRKAQGAAPEGKSPGGATAEFQKEGGSGIFGVPKAQGAPSQDVPAGKAPPSLLLRGQRGQGTARGGGTAEGGTAGGRCGESSCSDEMSPIPLSSAEKEETEPKRS